MEFSDDELRVMALSAPMIFRMLKNKEEKIVARMYGNFRNGQTEHLATIAELACVRDLIHEINAALFRGEKGS